MRSRILKAVFGIAGVTFLVIAFLEGWDRSQGFPLAPWPRLVLAGGAALVALRAGLLGWAALLQVEPRLVGPGFYTSQLGKYVPGGVWQAVGQVGYATSDVISAGRATVSFVAFAVTQAVSGAVVGALLAIAPGEVPTWLRLVATTGLLAVIVVRREWLVAMVSWYTRRRDDETTPEELVPPQAAIFRAAAWGGVSLTAAGIGFTLTLPVELTAVTVATAGLAFVLAWTVGFLALPVPAGVGVREAVLLAALGAVAGASAIVAAAV
ncbi:MAG: hypothetical protein R3320_14760, partial [Nitriliruptorales bacterium]|nr:hypothetical protein [Nitriliruptorales bacterium]